MQKGSTGRFSLRKAVAMSFVCFVCFSFIGTFLFDVRPALAATVVTDPNPLVAIVVDETGKEGPCTQTETHGTGKSATVVSYPCPAGTILHTETVHRSIALTLHEAYVILPPPGASFSEQKQAYDAILQLQAQKRPQSNRSTLAPLSCISGNAGKSTSATFDGNFIGFGENYNVSPGCSAITLDTTWETGYNVIDNDIFPNEDKYSNATFDWSCPDIRDNSTVSLHPNRIESYGLYYVFGWLDYGDLNSWGCTNIWGHNTWSASLGPLN